MSIADPATGAHDLARTLAARQCFHCSELLPAAPAQAAVAGEVQSFCCTGCAAAAQWIHDALLQDYYRLRNAASARVPTDTTDLGIWDREDIIAEHVRNVPAGREIVLLTGLCMAD
jgi:P-type Cu2+ transporter